MNRIESSMSGRRVLVTGASSGIGAAVARACLRQGASVGLVARRRDRLDEIAGSVRGHAVVIPVDLRQSASITPAVTEVAERLGGLDAVVNAAGLNRAGELDKSSVDHWREMLETNLLAAFAVTQAAMPFLIAARGDVVNVSSMSGHRTLRSNSAVYAATKAALNVWSEAMSWDVGRQGVRVMVISPGLVRTEFADQTPDDQLRSQMRRSLDEIGLSPEDVADQILHMLTQPSHIRLPQVAIMPTAQRR